MEQLKKLVPHQISSLTCLPQLKQSTELSIYRGELTTQGLVNGVKLIQKSFPQLPIEFYEVLKERVKANGFDDNRLMDAICHVIDTCVYPQPTIAQFIDFDRKVKLYTYDEMLRMCDELGREVWKSYVVVRLPDRKKPVWVHVDEEKYLTLK